MAELQNIIFDLGGVLLNIDYEKTSRAFHTLGFPAFENMYSQFTADRLFQKLETGAISEQDFYRILIEARLREQGGKEDKRETEGGGNIFPEEVKHAWNSMLLDWRTPSLHFLEKLGLKYRLFLLSNTNAIHMDQFNRSLKEQTGRDSIDGLFTKTYYSHLVNLRKPGEDIFEYILKDAGIVPAETLFVDDSANNIETAGKMGFRTHLLKAGELIEGLDYSSFSY